MRDKIKMIFATNEPRSKLLEAELEKITDEYLSINYDSIPFVVKYLAAALSYHPVRKVWWNKYQWHPVMQWGRRHCLNSAIRSSGLNYDVLLVWGSWFHPFKSIRHSVKPFYMYIDQSCNSIADAFDIQNPGLRKPRINFNKNQFTTYSDCEAIFCMSDWARRQTYESHPTLPEGKAMKVGWGPIGVNLLDEPFSFPDDELYILFVGHEFYRKGVDILRSAIPEVVKDFPFARFKVVGGNSDQLNIEPHPNLDIMGTIKDMRVMKDLFRNARAFVLPHRFDRSPHVLVEAMSAGRPIITSRQGGAPEVVKHGESGFLIEPADVQSLITYIKVLLENKDKCISFGNEGRKMMASGHTWKKIAEKMMDRIMSGGQAS